MLLPAISKSVYGENDAPPACQTICHTHLPALMAMAGYLAAYWHSVNRGTTGDGSL